MTSKNAIVELAPNAGYWHSTLNTDDVLVRTTDSTQKVFIGTTSNAEPALTISGNNLMVAGTMTANSYSNLPADPAGSWASNQSGAGVYASNAVPQGTFASNAIVGAAGGITFSSNLAVDASAAALFGSNLAVWSSNTLPTLNGAFSSNTAVFSSNVSSWCSNAALGTSNMALFGSNTSVSACNLAVAASNAVFPQAAFGSNIGVFASNLAIWCSNASADANDAWSSNAALFGSNLAVANSNVLFPQATYGSNQANTATTNAASALTVAEAASNIAVAGSNDASAGHLLAISTSNFAYPLGTYNSNTANTALTTSLWASNNGGGGGSASYWQLSNSLQYSMSNVSIGSTSNMYPLQVQGSIASAGLIVGRGVGALSGIPPTASSDFASNTAVAASNAVNSGLLLQAKGSFAIPAMAAESNAFGAAGMDVHVLGRGSAYVPLGKTLTSSNYVVVGTMCAPSGADFGQYVDATQYSSGNYYFGFADVPVNSFIVVSKGLSNFGIWYTGKHGISNYSLDWMIC